jgi:hypothetical protein
MAKPCGPPLTGPQRPLPNPHAEHLLDWFHLARRLTVMQQTAKGLPETIHNEEETSMLRAPIV